MKKWLLGLIICMLMISGSFANGVVYERPEIDIIVNGKEIVVTDVPIIVNSRTLIPLRTLLVALGVPDNDKNIQWIGEKRQVKVIYGDINIRLDIDSDTAYINNKAYQLDSPATIYNSRTYLPAKFVGEALGYGVFWDPYNPSVIVTKNERYEQNSQILTAVKDAMQNMATYDAKFAGETLITVTGSNFEEYTQKVIQEKVDWYNNLMEVRTVHKENEIVGTLEYYSDDAKYYNRDYENDFSEAAWNVSEYNASYSDKTPFETKKKFLDFQIDESLYSMLDCIETEETYCLYSITNNEDLLKCFADAGLCYEVVDGNGKIKELRTVVYVDKLSFYPTCIKVEVERQITGNEEYGVDNVVTENSSFYLTVDCDKELTIELPQ